MQVDTLRAGRKRELAMPARKRNGVSAQGIGQARQRNSQQWLDSEAEEAGEADSLLAE
jgi:hypothetical protein